MSSLKGKVVAISGASAGIGLACAELFARAGCHLVLGARRLERLEANRERLMSMGAVSVGCIALDVCTTQSVNAFAAETLRLHKTVDIIFNNAGLAKGSDSVATGKDADWEAMVQTNILGALRFVRAFIPGMVAANNGHIINMGSVAGHQVYVGGAVYAGTKHAVRALTQTLRLELNGTALRVSSLDPGMVETEFSVVRFNDAQKAKDVYKGMTPLTAHDIAETVLFVASRPAHVNIEQMVIMPTDQATVYKVHRRS